MTILTVTLNPALDLESTTPLLAPGDKLRCAEPRRDPGGGGINVARAVALLGGEATAVLAAGGPTGEGIAQQLRAQGVPIAVLPAPGETRSNLSMIETSTGKQYRFIFPGPVWQAEDVAGARAALQALVKPGDIVVLSGSLPPGMQPVQLVDLAAALAGQGAQVVADTSGPALVALSQARAALKILRMDSGEARELSGLDLATRQDSAAFAKTLIAAAAAEIVIIARGADGSVLATAEGTWFAPAVEVPVASVTGAGDSFVAGSVLALSRGLPVDAVLQWGCAAASSAVTTAATELCDRAMFEQLLPLSMATPI
jgi:6-phosphofructokinase 2